MVVSYRERVPKCSFCFCPQLLRHGSATDSFEQSKVSSMCLDAAKTLEPLTSDTTGHRTSSPRQWKSDGVVLVPSRCALKNTFGQ
jgi:hypothetical protein